MAERKKHWIDKAIQHPGAESAAAKRAGMSTLEYAEKHDNDPGRAGRRARLAEMLIEGSRKRAKNG